MAQNKYLGKFNSGLDKVVKTLGVGKDQDEVYEEEELRSQVQGFLESNNSNMSEQQVEFTTDQFLRRIEDIVDEAIHTGRKQERMKGEDSDDLYNMVLLSMFSSVVSVGVLIWVHFA
jgi:DNA-binding protein Fis